MSAVMTTMPPENTNEASNAQEAGVNRQEAKTKDKADGVDGGESGPKTYAEVGFGDIFKQFVLLGWTAFGGPAAHIALFQVSAECRLAESPASAGS